MKREIKWKVEAENRQFNQECLDTHIFVCSSDGRGETNVPHLQWHGRRVGAVVK